MFNVYSVNCNLFILIKIYICEIPTDIYVIWMFFCDLGTTQKCQNNIWIIL